MKKFFLIAILVLGGMFLATAVFALTISPPVIEMGADPGQSLRSQIEIFNETDREAAFYTSTSNFTAKPNEKGEPEFFTAGGIEKGLADWIEIEEGPIWVAPKEWKVVPFSLRVPEYADPGGHYAAIFLGTERPEIAPGQTGVGIVGKVGTLVLLRVSGDIFEEGRLAEFSLKDGKKFYEHLPVDFLVRFENLGNIHLKPQGEIYIKNIFGKASGIVDVNKVFVGGNVLPKTIRRFESSWIKKPFEEPPQGFFAKLKTEYQNFALGRYRANLVLGYGTQGKLARGTLIFWVFPWHLILVVLISTGILIFLLIRGIKTYNRWIIKRAIQRSG